MQSRTSANVHSIIERVCFPCGGLSSCLSCASCASMFNNPEFRINLTGSLFPIGREDLLFHPRLIRLGVGWRGQARGQTGVSQRAPVGFQRSRPPDTLHRTIGTAHPGARASRPHPLPWVVAQFPCDGAPVHRAGGNRMGPAEAEPWRRCRSIRVEEMGEALPVLCGRDARAPGWASSHDVVISRSRYRRCIRARLVIEAGPSLFVFIRVHWWFVFKNDRQFLPRMIRTAGRGPGLPGIRAAGALPPPSPL